MAKNLLSSDIAENMEVDDIQEIFKILNSQQEELEAAKDTGDGGWRCVCHKIQSSVLAAVKQTVHHYFLFSLSLLFTFNLYSVKKTFNQLKK